MILKFTKTIRSMICVLSLSLIAVSAQAAKLDPTLQALLQRSSSSADTRIIRVIALFHEKLPAGMKEIPHGMNHGQTMRLMQKMASASQTRFRDKRFPYPSEGLWFLNARIIDLPVKELRNLAGFPEISYLGANHEMRIGLPYRHTTPLMHSDSGYTYGLEKLGIPKLRETMPTLIGKGVRVGVLDTGVDAAHPDLKGKIAGWKDFIAKKPEPYDDNNHGTHVSGTIAGGSAGGTEIGIAPGAEILMGKVFTGGGSGSTDIILKGMEWMADPDGNPSTADQPKLVSNSWGGGTPRPSENPDDNVFCKALNRWVALGILPVFAAGNSGPGAKTVNVPGACPLALTVGATDSEDVVASFSSRGPVFWKTGELIRPIVSAPGVKVLSSVAGGKYAEFSGTSMATPHVAGLSALLFQKNPKLKPEELVAILSKSAFQVGGKPPGAANNDTGFGRIDALKAVSTAGRRR